MDAVTDRAGVVRVIEHNITHGLHWQFTDAEIAQRALAALEAAGLRVVPVERTDDMHHGAQRTTGAIITRKHSAELWNAMLAASPFAPPKETQE